MRFLNGIPFYLKKKGSRSKIAATISYEAGKDTATLDPTKSLQKGATYKALVTNGAKDVTGNPLDQESTKAGLQNYKWLFTLSLAFPEWT